jgi:hypothetical protein
MSIILPDLSDVISGIITLGANGGEQLFPPKIHTALYQMKQHNKMLTGLWFSRSCLPRGREHRGGFRRREKYRVPA